MSLKQNIRYSKAVCEHILKILHLKGANWDQYRGVSTSYESCLGKGGTEKSCKVYKDSVDICLYDKVRPKVKRLIIGEPLMLSKIRILANTAKNNKCGNCGEFSALAFMLLYDYGVKPIDWMALKGGDHAFVVIGRSNKNANDFKNWGSEAVICDPWGRGFRSGDIKTGTYAASEFEANMRGLVSFSGVRSLHQEN